MHISGASEVQLSYSKVFKGALDVLLLSTSSPGGGVSFVCLLLCPFYMYTHKHMVHE